ncbi:MAG: hypothetical protein KBB88_03220 [Candidatus Pacebacteria bacterium]|nr:hypothetical protein [Candidatus Paceibacterota bacterium]
MQLPTESENSNLDISLQLFHGKEPLVSTKVDSLVVPHYYFSIATYAIILIAVLVSLAIVYHWYRYARNKLGGFLVLAVYLIGFFILAGNFFMKGITQ